MTLAINLFIIFWLSVIPAGYADTIYTWTDQNGAQRYSNEPPPEHVKAFKRIETPTAPANTPMPGSRRRPGYDRMVEKSASEADQLERQRQLKDSATESEKRRMAENRRKSKIQSQRQQLEGKIATIKKRAVSPSYPPGMKAAQIREIQKQIERLEKSAHTTDQ